LLNSKLGRLESSSIVFDFLDIVSNAAVLPSPLRPLQKGMVRAAVDITPQWVRERLGLGSSHGLAAWERKLLRQIGATADRLLLPSSPPVQSCLRLGLPADYLLRGRRH
jgi:uncharacterized protein (DUF2236 family)